MMTYVNIGEKKIVDPSILSVRAIKIPSNVVVTLQHKDGVTLLPIIGPKNVSMCIEELAKWDNGTNIQSITVEDEYEYKIKLTKPTAEEIALHYGVDPDTLTTEQKNDLNEEVANAGKIIDGGTLDLIVEYIPLGESSMGNSGIVLETTLDDLKNGISPKVIKPSILDTGEIVNEDFDFSDYASEIKKPLVTKFTTYDEADYKYEHKYDDINYGDPNPNESTQTEKVVVVDTTQYIAPLKDIGKNYEDNLIKNKILSGGLFTSKNILIGLSGIIIIIILSVIYRKKMKRTERNYM